MISRGLAQSSTTTPTSKTIGGLNVTAPVPARHAVVEKNKGYATQLYGLEKQVDGLEKELHGREKELHDLENELHDWKEKVANTGEIALTYSMMQKNRM